MQHRTRDLLMRQRTQAINALRAHMAELGIVAAQGREGLKELLAIIADEKHGMCPDHKNTPQVAVPLLRDRSLNNDIPQTFTRSALLSAEATISI
jgi:hypothetical protein